MIFFLIVIIFFGFFILNFILSTDNDSDNKYDNNPKKDDKSSDDKNLYTNTIELRKSTIKTKKYVTNYPKGGNNKIVITRSDSIKTDLWRNEILYPLNESFSLSDLIINKDLKDIYYANLLQCFEWKYKRLKILLRDSYKCTDCNKISKFHHVHHTYYLQDRLPWDIEDNALVTLCYNCHKKRHELEAIPVFKKDNYVMYEVSNERPQCSRCGGIGYFAEYSHVEGGVCFKCRGNTIDKSVYFNIIKSIYENLDNYQDNKLREECRNYIFNISEYEILLKYPDALEYLKQRKIMEDEGDGLPF